LIREDKATVAPAAFIGYSDALLAALDQPCR